MKSQRKEILDVPVFHNNTVSIEIPEGNVCLLLSLMRPTSGNIELFGLPPKDHQKEIYGRVGALIESPSLYEHLSATENLRVTATYLRIGKARIDDVLAIVGLENEGKKPVKAYSTGMKQRLGLALALLNDPELIILDEPTNGLDPQGIVELRGIIQRLNTDFGKTIFLSSHILSEIEMICDYVGIIKKGKKLFEGTINQLKATNTEGVSVHLDTDNQDKTRQLLTDFNTPFLLNDQSNALVLNLQNKEQISPIVHYLVKNDVGIYEVAIKNQRLEDLFLTLNEHQS